MSVPSEHQKHARCESCSGTSFTLRVMRDEGVACAGCVGCSRDYLLLDSGDHWFDVIQERWPRTSRCSCKNKTFGIRLDYYFREDGDVESINVWSRCAACGKTKRQMTVDVDYGDTGDLTRHPLVFCKNPKVLYDLRQLTSYATPRDITSVASHLADEGCLFVCWRRSEDAWIGQQADRRTIEEVILTDDYLRIYASLAPIDLSREALRTAQEERTFWRRREVIRFSCPTRMAFRDADGRGSRVGLLYYIEFSNDLVEDERAVPKSDAFRALTSRLERWLGERFVSWTGPRSFDNQDEHLRLFGDEFRAKRRPTK